MAVAADKQIVQNFKDTIPKMTTADKEKLLAFSEGVALAVGFKLTEQTEGAEGGEQ